MGADLYREMDSAPYHHVLTAHRSLVPPVQSVHAPESLRKCPCVFTFQSERNPPDALRPCIYVHRLVILSVRTSQPRKDVLPCNQICAPNNATRNRTGFDRSPERVCTDRIAGFFAPRYSLCNRHNLTFSHIIRHLPRRKAER